MENQVTNYKFKKGDIRLPEIMFRLKESLSSGQIDNNILSNSDIILTNAILYDLEMLGISEKEDLGVNIYAHKKFKNFPNSIIVDYMESYRLYCNYDSPIKEEYLNQLTQKPESMKLNQNVNESNRFNTSQPVQVPTQTPNQPQQPVINEAKYVPSQLFKVVQFKPKNIGQTLSTDGTKWLEAEVDDEILTWYNINNLNSLRYSNESMFQNMIISLRSIIPALQKKESPDRHAIYQVIQYTDPTNFLLADICRGSNQVLVQNGQVSTNF